MTSTNPFVRALKQTGTQTTFVDESVCELELRKAFVESDIKASMS